jgi:hypothetical protein
VTAGLSGPSASIAANLIVVGGVLAVGVAWQLIGRRRRGPWLDYVKRNWPSILGGGIAFALIGADSATALGDQGTVLTYLPWHAAMVLGFGTIVAAAYVWSRRAHPDAWEELRNRGFLGLSGDSRRVLLIWCVGVVVAWLIPYAVFRAVVGPPGA